MLLLVKIIKYCTNFGAYIIYISKDVNTPISSIQKRLPGVKLVSCKFIETRGEGKSRRIFLGDLTSHRSVASKQIVENRRVNGSRVNRRESRTFREFTTPQGPVRFIIDVLSRIHHSMTGRKCASLPPPSTRLVDNFRFDPRASLLWHRKCTFLYDYPPAILRLVAHELYD